MKAYPSGGVICTQSKYSRPENPLISIIIPMYNEEEGLETLFAETEKILNALDIEYELICIDDGSTDNTYEKITQYNSSHISAYRFSKNHGKEIAISAGIDLAKGDAVIPMDADLQEPPSLIPKMIKNWKDGYDVVLGIKNILNTDSKSRILGSKIFYKFFNCMSKSKIAENAGDFRLMDRKVIEVIKMMPERNRFMKGLLSWPGFKTTSFTFTCPERMCGTSKWSASQLLTLAIDGITSFSVFPLRLCTMIGGVISLLSLLYAVFVIVKYVISGDTVQGYASLMATMSFLGGLQLLGLGIVGEYIGKIYTESKKRPLYIIKDTHNYVGEND